MKVLTFLLITIFTFSVQSPVFAESRIYQTKIEYISRINYTTNNFFNIEEPYQLVEKTEINNDNSVIWLTSAFVPGLGQILMGDILRGAKFTLLFTLIAALDFILIPILAMISYGASVSGQGGFNLIAFLSSAGIITGIIVLIFSYIWNITDAYLMSKEIEDL